MSQAETITKLPQEVINQIAAGEVVERPASVVKELVDNSLDAGADKIIVEIYKGGKKKIVVRDNGSGMNKEDLQIAFQSHTTSKVKNIDDLDRVLSMGFRGEALASILSVSKVEVISKSNDSSGHKAIFKGIEVDQIVDHPASRGTALIISDIFYNIPARLKYLRTDETEYRYIYTTLLPYFLIRGNVHFVLIKDGKELLNLPKVNQFSNGEISIERIQSIFNSPFKDELIPIYFDGNGIKVKGFIASPNHHQKKATHKYIFVNGRPISDRGISRSITEGLGTYIPKGDIVPFFINLELSSGMVDVNVHPRKEEVKFLNPFRVYSAVEQAVAGALKKEYKSGGSFSNVDSKDEIAYSRLRDSKSIVQSNQSSETPLLRNYDASQGPKSSIKDSIRFSADILTNDEQQKVELFNSSDQEKSIHQVFDKYIILELNQELWIIDQHAAAERITFEELKREISNGEVQLQDLLLPKEFSLEDNEISFLIEKRTDLEKLGLIFRIDKNVVKVDAVPTIFSDANIEHMIKDLYELEEEESGEVDITEKENEVIASMACHTSIRTGQGLKPEEMKSLVERLFKCENPYSCPHGRPIVWKLGIDEIDINFERTY